MRGSGHLAKAQIWRPVVWVHALSIPAVACSRQAGTELLEEKRRSRGLTSIADVACPLELHGTVVRTRFAADNQPVDTTKVEVIEGPEERLCANETNCCRRFPERIGSFHPTVQLN